MMGLKKIEWKIRRGEGKRESKRKDEMFKDGVGVGEG